MSRWMDECPVFISGPVLGRVRVRGGTTRPRRAEGQRLGEKQNKNKKWAPTAEGQMWQVAVTLEEEGTNVIEQGFP